MREVAACIIENGKKEILLQKKTVDWEIFPRAWTLFGGVIKRQESPLRAVIREIDEELGLKIRPKYCFESLSKLDNGTDSKMFVFHTVAHLSQIKKINEGAGLAFFSEKELDELTITNDSKNALKLFLGI